MNITQAIETNNIEYVRDNISKFDPNQLGEYGNSLLHRAAYWGHLEIIDILICNGADVDILNEDRVNPLHSIIDGNEGNWFETIELLINKGANVNTYRVWHDFRKSEDKESILITAVKSELYSGVIELLLKHGADVDFVDATGDKAINYAYDLNHTEAIDLLESYGAKYDGKITYDEQILRDVAKSQVRYKKNIKDNQ